ncbi:hypothetical protein Fmac_016375 [Flemingia macrophylla]|uniref:Ribosomal protein S10 n=1 Tax=Flemingia macrophylla TaxID=520843 RepID=A0ABD1MHY3_9FABA
MKFCAIRSARRRCGISFTVPDRVTSEISDKKRIVGKHPLRITRIPAVGSKELQSLVQQAIAQGSSPMTSKKRKHDGKTRRAYHRSHINDWDVEVFYFEPIIEDQTQISHYFCW